MYTESEYLHVGLGVTDKASFLWVFCHNGARSSADRSSTCLNSYNSPNTAVTDGHCYNRTNQSAGHSVRFGFGRAPVQDLHCTDREIIVDLLINEEKVGNDRGEARSSILLGEYHG